MMTTTTTTTTTMMMMCRWYTHTQDRYLCAFTAFVPALVVVAAVIILFFLIFSLTHETTATRSVHSAPFSSHRVRALSMQNKYYPQAECFIWNAALCACYTYMKCIWFRLNSLPSLRFEILRHISHYVLSFRQRLSRTHIRLFTCHIIFSQSRLIFVLFSFPVLSSCDCCVLSEWLELRRHESISISVKIVLFETKQTIKTNNIVRENNAKKREILCTHLPKHWVQYMRYYKRHFKTFTCIISMR